MKVNQGGTAHDSAPQKPRLDAIQAGTVERAREALEASREDGDPGNFARHLGALEASLDLVLEVLGQLTGGAR